MSKEFSETRQRAIKELIGKHLIADQMTLVNMLKEQFGLETNQAVVSRDLRKLNIVKKMIRGSLAYEIPALDVKNEILKLALLEVDHNEAMIVIKTHAGLADFVGDYIDDYQDEMEILGCLSGENVVFVTPKSIKNIHNTFLALCEKLGFKKDL